MMNNLLCKTFVMGALICSTQLSAQKVSDKQPWSVRMVESEMIRCPESWQLSGANQRSHNKSFTKQIVHHSVLVFRYIDYIK